MRGRVVAQVVGNLLARHRAARGLEAEGLERWMAKPAGWLLRIEAGTEGLDWNEFWELLELLELDPEDVLHALAVMRRDERQDDLDETQG